MANLVFDFLHAYETGERRESEPANAYQYDEGHVLEAVLPSAVTSCEIHYWIRGQEKSEAYTPGSITQNDDGSCTVIGNIPNLYFETNGELRVYIVVTDGDASITTYEGYIHICQRSMPDDYVDDDPENEATRVLTEAQEAAATATAAAQTAQDVADSIPEDYSQLSDDVGDLKDGLSSVENNILTDNIREALLQLASKVAYIDDDGQDYYDALEDALYPSAELVSISAVYTQSGTVLDTASLNDLKADLVVTATYEDSSTAVVTTYTLSGTLTTGTSTITVYYGGKTATFTVTVTHDDSGDWDYIWTYEDGLPPASDWTWSTGGGSGQVHEIVNDGMKMTAKNGTNCNYAMPYSSDAVLSGGGGIVEFKFYIPSEWLVSTTVNCAYLQLVIGNGTNGVRICMTHPKHQNNALYVKLYDNSDIFQGTTIGTWTFDTQHTVRLEMDSTTMKGNVYFDGTLLSENIDISTILYAVRIMMYCAGGTVNSAGVGAIIQSVKVKYAPPESGVTS